MNHIKKELKKKSIKKKAIILQKFFKTKKGDYGEKDVFIGVSVPEQRKIAKNNISITLKKIQELLNSRIHEERQTALIILILKYNKTKKDNNIIKKEIILKNIFDFYLKNIKNINNWDLVDVSAPKIVGDYLLEKKSERKILFELANTKKTKNSFEWLWRKRIAIVSTQKFIKNNDFKATIKLAKKYLKEKHDLLHKATGWMLREIGKRDEKTLNKFLDKHYKEMPRTMLRYAIEKFDEEERKKYLGKK
jgi:3-methyladenine DNA glycosylase AlkD